MTSNANWYKRDTSTNPPQTGSMLIRTVCNILLSGFTLRINRYALVTDACESRSHFISFSRLVPVLEDVLKVSFFNVVP